jgi:hypothetical protein
MNTANSVAQIKADHDVLNLAMEHTIQILEQHGNTVSNPQWNELYKVLGSFVYTIAHPEQQRRSAFPLS